MEIPEITLTIEEMNEAVQSWLHSQGLKVIVSKVKSNGYPTRDFSVECASTTMPSPQEQEAK